VESNRLFEKLSAGKYCGVPARSPELALSVNLWAINFSVVATMQYFFARAQPRRWKI